MLMLRLYSGSLILTNLDSCQVTIQLRSIMLATPIIRMKSDSLTLTQSSNCLVTSVLTLDND